MKERLKNWLRVWLGIERAEERITRVEKHFVTKRDPRTSEPLETLADRAADEDGRDRPEPLPRSRQWNQMRRLLESQNAAPRKPKGAN